MDDLPPPTVHTLRPHHISLLAVFLLLFKEYEASLPLPFTLHVYRVLLNQVSEVSAPKSHPDLLRELSTGPKAEDIEARKMIAKLKGVPGECRTPDSLTILFHNVTGLFLEKSEEETPILLRRSVFGYFCRRCFVTFVKLSFSGVVKLQKDYLLWCAGNIKAGYEPPPKDPLTNDSIIFKTHADTKTWAQPEPYAAWEKAQATGDETMATENLRRFFEQHFHESNDSGIRQHALLNLVRMHYLRSEFPAARKLLLEAITVARTSSDKLTLQHCIAMLHRLPHVEEGRRPVLNDIQPDLNPLEILFDVKKLMAVEHDQPPSAAFEKIMQAIGMYDHWIDSQHATPVESDQWGQHAVQAYVWRLIGCDRVADIEENVVTAFTEVGGNDNNRFTVTLNRAYNRARQGQYEAGLAILLEPDVWRGISMDDYGRWAHKIWNIVTLRASRRGQLRLYREFLYSRRPLFPEPHVAKEYFFDVVGGTLPHISEELFQVISLKQRYDQGSSTVEPLLRALWHAEFQCRLGLYRTGIILLADVCLDFGMTERCRRILEEILPQVITGGDLEQRGTACYTFARCILASSGNKDAGLKEAVHYLLMAESDFATIQSMTSLINARYLLSIVYHNLGMEAKRDQAAERHMKAVETSKTLEIVVDDEEVAEIWEVVSSVGAALAAR